MKSYTNMLQVDKDKGLIIIKVRNPINMKKVI